MQFHSHESVIDVNVTIVNDNLEENNETFVIYLMEGVGVKLSPYPQAEIIIINDDESKGMLFINKIRLIIIANW